MALKANLLDLRYARSAIGFEYQPKHPGHEIVEILARLGIRKFGTLRTSLDELL
jgi:hypothetical protein